MNINTATKMVQSLSTGTFAGRDWINPTKCYVYFKGGYARDVLVDYGQLLGSGPRVGETVTVTDRQMLRALRKVAA